MGAVSDPAAPTVVVVGSINVDLVVRASRLPAAGETVTGGTFHRYWGGKGANQAVAARRFGANVHMVGAVGDDDHGRGALLELSREGVRTEQVRTDATTATGTALIVVDSAGQNQIAVASGANHLVDVTSLATVLCAQPRGVLVTGFEVPAAVVDEALRVAAAREWRVVVNPAPARPLSTAFRGSGAILTPNEHELRQLVDGDGDTRTLAQRLAAFTVGPVLVTLGARGAFLAYHEAAMEIPAPAIAPLDTTGAGDVFTGVLAAALAAGMPLERAATWAVYAASLSTEVAGARGAPTRSALTSRWPLAPG